MTRVVITAKTLLDGGLEGKAPYTMLSAVGTEERPFAAATVRHVDFVDSTGTVLPSSKRMTPPLDASATIVCLGYAASMDEIIIGASNAKVYTFCGATGRLVRQCRATMQPVCLEELDHLELFTVMPAAKIVADKAKQKATKKRPVASR